MNLSANGLALIKKYEGYRATAYKPVPTEKFWTIGYGHYGPDVQPGMTITEAQGAELLRGDCAAAEAAVNKLPYEFTQNEFDALVSFTYNCGAGNLKKLTNNGRRSKAEIANKILAYNKGGGKVLKGLEKRRKEEQTLFLSGSNSALKKVETIATPIYLTDLGQKGHVSIKPGSNLNVRAGASTSSPVLELVQNGKILYTRELLGDWYHVVDPDNMINGFVNKKYFVLEK